MPKPPSTTAANAIFMALGVLSIAAWLAGVWVIVHFVRKFW